MKLEKESDCGGLSLETRGDAHNSQPNSMAESGVHEIAFRLIKKYLPNPGKVVDIGSGEGAFSQLLISEGHSVVALDLDVGKLKTPEIELRLCDLNKDFVNEAFGYGEKFDAVIAIEVIEHLENPFAFVRECRKLLVDDGILLITTPNVEAVNSRLLYLYKGRLFNFGEFETVPTGHITPIFGWKAEYILRQAGMHIVYRGYSDVSYFAGAGLKGKIGRLMVRLLEKIVKGDQGGPTLIVIAKPETN